VPQLEPSTALLAVEVGLHRDLVSLLVIALVAACVPLAVGLLRIKIAEVVLLLALGVLVGPSLLGWVEITDGVRLVSELGLGLLFFLAGYELEQHSLRGSSGTLAIRGWITSLALACLVAWALKSAGFINDFLGIAIALTTTALGTLLPMLRDRGLLPTPFGTFFMGAGALGEFGPILAVALLLGSKSLQLTLIVLAAFAVVAWLLWQTPGRLATERLRELFERGHRTSSQTAVRWTVVLLLVLLVVASTFGFDAVLGAFVAGVILRRYAPPGESNILLPKIEAIGFGFFVPVFFVVSGATLDIASIAASPVRLLVFFLLLLAVRGLPQFFLYRRALPDARRRAQFALYVGTALPMLVAITQIEVGAGAMLEENAAALVGAGVLSILVFPLLGDRLGRGAASIDGADAPEAAQAADPA